MSRLKVSYWLLAAITIVLWIKVDGQIYISPTGTASPASCGSGACTEADPCGPDILGPVFGVELDSECYVRIIEGEWTVPVKIFTTPTNAFDVEIYQSITGSAISNLTLIIDTTSFASASSNTVLRGMKMERSTVMIRGQGDISIQNSIFDFSGVSGASLDLKSQESIFFKNVSIENTAPGSVAILLTSHVSLDECTFTMPLATFSTSAIGSMSISRSQITARTLIGNVASSLNLETTVFRLGSLAHNPETDGMTDAPEQTMMTSSAFYGLGGEISPMILFQGGQSVSFTARNCDFRNVAFSQGLRLTASLTMEDNIIFNFPVKLLLMSNTTECRITNNTFTTDLSDTVALDLNPGSLAHPIPYISQNTFIDQSQSAGSGCQVRLNNLQFTNSNLTADVICIAGVVEWDGNLTIHNAIRAEPPAAQLHGIDTGGRSLSGWTLHSITYDPILSIVAPLTYIVTQPTRGIRPYSDGPTAEQVILVDSVDILWQASQPPVVGNEYPLIFNFAANTPFPLQREPSSPQFTYEIRPTFMSGRVDLYFAILSVQCASNCNLEHSNSTCLILDTCNCINGWTGPTCDSPPPLAPAAPTGCSSSPPGPGFTCINGQWVSSTPVEEPVFEIPPNSGPIVIEGDLNVTQTIVFNGLGSEVVVNGCVIIEGEVVVELTESELEELLGGGKTKVLISSISDGACTNATDLSQVEIITKSPKECSKVSGQNTGTRQSLSVLFNVDASGCKKKSNLVAIVVPSVIGAVIILGVIGALIWWKIRHDMMHKP